MIWSEHILPDMQRRGDGRQASDRHESRGVQQEESDTHRRSDESRGASASARIPTLVSRADARGVRDYHREVAHATVSASAELRTKNDTLLDANMELTTENFILRETNEDVRAQLDNFITEQKKINQQLRKDVEAAKTKSNAAVELAERTLAMYDSLKEASEEDFDFYSHVIVDMQEELVNLGGSAAAGPPRP